ncbi:MAG: lysophospholipid acyltransferase family protein [Flavobacteriales bacterium]|jgi:1-acyl-sn-glycerol-3-phosphate acyltransferase|tara:strand:+ start:549 stop:1352 length:804 start_codon:yes stop_codon:yes gene_type:complete
MGIFKQDPFGHYIFLKRWLIQLLGGLSHRRYQGFNSMNIEGSEIIRELPERNILFVSNHQTYFADVTAMHHVFNASLKGRIDSIKNVTYLWNPKTNLYYVAATETMESGLLPKIMAYVGAVSIKRTWRENGETISRAVDASDTENIGVALNDGWVITFPQGTTRAFNPIRKGTAHIIKQYKPIVVPIVIDGFRRSFDKKGLFIKKKGILQSMVIKKPLEIDYENDSVEKIVEQLEYAIEQHPSFIKVPTEEYLKQKKERNKKREFWT